MIERNLRLGISQCNFLHDADCPVVSFPSSLTFVVQSCCSLFQVLLLKGSVFDWDWLFDSDFSPLRRFEDHTNAVSKECVSSHGVQHIPELVKKYGLKEGQTVSLFSQNRYGTLWSCTEYCAQVWWFFKLSN